MEKLLIVHARLPHDEFTSDANRVLLVDGKIADTSYAGGVDGMRVFDAKGMYLLPSFIELHAHGGGGYDFCDGTEEAFDAIMRLHLSHGVTRLCPTAMTCEWSRLIKLISFLADHSSHFMFGGIHLEGPFLSPVMCGAQSLGAMVAPTSDKIDALAEYAGVLSCITAAPECEGVGELAKRLVPLGVSMSVGHSNADANDMRRACEWGFSRVTHLFSSTSRRAKQGSYVVGGIEECALLDDRLTVELIGDGHHVCTESLHLTAKCKGLDRVVLVSDAMRAAGMEPMPEESFLGAVMPENRVIIEDGVAKLPDRSSFAGSVATGDTMVRALMARGDMPLSSLSKMLSETPARLLGLEKCGRICRDYRADLVLLDESYRTSAVFADGKQVYGGNR